MSETCPHCNAGRTRYAADHGGPYYHYELAGLETVPCTARTGGPGVTPSPSTEELLPEILVRITWRRGCWYPTSKKIEQVSSDAHADAFVDGIRKDFKDFELLERRKFYLIDASRTLPRSYTDIRAAALEEAAKVVAPSKPRPCDCESCYCGNAGDAETVAMWDAENWAAKRIRALIALPPDSERKDG